MRLIESEKLDGRPIVHKFSFGKDSYACLLALIDAGLSPSAVLYCETGWEHPDHYRYAEAERIRLLQRYGVDVVTVQAQISLPVELIPVALELEKLAGLPSPSPMIRRTLKYACFSRPGRGPGGGKWCTSDLKQLPAARWLESSQDELPVVTTGIRREESFTRSKYQPWEQQTRPPHCDEWRPILDWTVEDVGRILTRHGIPRHPAYLAGSNRVGCWPCIHAGKEEIECVGRDAARVEVVTRLEKLVTELSSGKRGAGWFQAKSPDLDGHYPPVPIVDAIEWSRTSRGGKQFLLWERAPEDPCIRWGWCEV